MSRKSARKALTLLLGASALMACASTIPGASECERVAARSLGVSDEVFARDPRARAAYAQIVNQCLTTPWDLQIVRCVEESGALPWCLADFARRHPERVDKRF